MRTYFVDWYGPFEDAELGTKTLKELLDWPELAKNGLYIITGKRKGQRVVRVQYIGIS